MYKNRTLHIIRQPLLLPLREGEDIVHATRNRWNNMRETVWPLSSMAAGNLREAARSTRGPGWTNLQCICCRVSGIAE